MNTRAWLVAAVLPVMPTQGVDQEVGKPLTGSTQLIETKARSEAVFKDNIVARGLFAVILTLTNSATDTTYVIRRPDIILQTEFDARVVSLEAQRAYDRLMLKVGGGPYFAEAGIARAITEGSRKRKLRQSLLAKALGESIKLAPNQEIEGALFFELPKGAKTMQFSTLVIQEMVDEKTGQRFSLRLPLAANP